MKEAESCLHHISGNLDGGFKNPAEKAIGELRSHVEFAEVSEIIDFGLHEYLDNLQIKLNKLSELIDSTYFRLRDNFISQNQDQ